MNSNEIEGAILRVDETMILPTEEYKELIKKAVCLEAIANSADKDYYISRDVLKVIIELAFPKAVIASEELTS